MLNANILNFKNQRQKHGIGDQILDKIWQNFWEIFLGRIEFDSKLLFF